MSIIRTRWAAIGAAVAVTLGAGGIGIVSATQPGDAVTFVPITPCRVMDTRTEFNVGPKTSPLGPGEVYTVNTTTADTGNCSGIPTTATGVSLNITALDATRPTFLTVWATGAAQPEASSLNPVPGQPPTPNAVTTGINTNGQFDIYNLQGNVQVIADINGYYTDHHHDDRYYTEPEVDAAIADKANTADVYLKAEVDAAIAPKPQILSLGAIDFQPANHAAAFAYNYVFPGGVQVADGFAFFNAGVRLPAGSTITGVEVFLDPNGNDKLVHLTRYRPLDPTSEIIASGSSTNGTVSEAIELGVNHTVEAGWNYRIDSISLIAGGAILYGAEISYLPPP